MEIPRPGVCVVECHGANPELQLENSVQVTVDVTTDGVRRIGCPFTSRHLWRFGRAPVEEVIYCELSSGKFTSLHDMEKERGRIKSERRRTSLVGGISYEEKQQEELGVRGYLEEQFLPCIHKHPE